MKKEHIIPAVEKTIGLLERLGRSNEGVAQAELAKELDITASTCYRIIQTLKKYDWICKLPGGRYDVSGGLLSAAMRLTDHAVRFGAAQPLLEKLSSRTGLSGKLSIRQGNEQVTILRTESSRPMGVSGRLGARFPIVEGSVGAALLSADGEKDIIRLAAECREGIVEKTKPEIILARIRDIRRQKYCLNTKLNRWKVGAMSAPVTGSGGRVAAAITLLGLDDDFRKVKLNKLAVHLRKAAAECARLT